MGRVGWAPCLGIVLRIPPTTNYLIPTRKISISTVSVAIKLFMAAQPRIKGPTWARSPLVTVSGLGNQIVWSTEMAFASPYLLSLGLSRAVMALVFVAGPLCGLIVQPIIGVLADTSTSKYGRRTPFMLGGCIATGFGMLLLGFTRQFVSLFATNPSHASDVLTAILAVVALYIIDFSINAVMAVDRALIVDVLSEAEQQDANAWSSRMVAVGGVSGFFICQLDLPTYLPMLGSTQLEVLSVLTTVILLVVHLITIFHVKEVPLQKKPDTVKSSSLSQSIRLMIASCSDMPPGMMKICMIQFFTCLAWFPTCFFTTIWIGELYRKQYPDSINPVEATQAGTRALLSMSFLSLIMSTTLPFVVAPFGSSGPPRGEKEPTYASRIWKRLPFTLDLPTAWAISLLIFGLVLWSTLFLRSVQAATWCFALIGIPGTCCHWAPYTILGEIMLADSTYSGCGGAAHQMSYMPLNAEDADPERTPIAESFSERGSIELKEPHDLDGLDDEKDGSPKHKDKAGIFFGIVNVFNCLPQFIIIAISSAIFAIFEPERGLFDKGARSLEGATTGGSEKHVDTIGLIFRIGGTGALVASYLAWGFAKELRQRCN